MFFIPIEEKIQGLRLAWVEAKGVSLGPAPTALQERCEEVAQSVLQEGLPGGDQRRGAIRDLLRQGGFKPSGRSKPAQEYLLRTVQQTGFPTILNAVDINNWCSLSSGLPISLVALDRVGTDISVRWGRAGEEYIFNASGQSLDVAGLICLCQGHGEASIPVANPVKDSMFAKLATTDQHVLACLYSSVDAMSTQELRGHAEAMAKALEDWAGATSTEVIVCDEDGIALP